MRSRSDVTVAVAQFTKFVVVGCVNVGVGFAIFTLFYRYFRPVELILDATRRAGFESGDLLARVGSPDAGIAYLLGAATGMATSFVLNKYWTFDARGLAGTQLRRFLALNVLNISASTALMSLMVDFAGIPYIVSWIAVTGLAMLVNFFANKYWTFAAAPTPGQRTA